MRYKWFVPKFKDMTPVLYIEVTTSEGTLSIPLTLQEVTDLVVEITDYEGRPKVPRKSTEWEELS